MQAEAQAKVAKKRDKQERKILDSQERAFWDVYRPPPGQVNTTEMDIKKMYKLNQIFGQEQTPVLDKLETSQLNRQLAALQVRDQTGAQTERTQSDHLPVSPTLPSLTILSLMSNETSKMVISFSEK